MALAIKKDAAICAWDLNAAASAAPALAKDKQRQEEAAAHQHWAEEEHITALVVPLNHVDAAIWHIQADCALHAAPLDAILAEIEHEGIAQNALVWPMTILPPPMAMLSTSPCPMSYVGAVLATMGRSAPLTLPLPTVNSQLQMVHQCA
jgi:hypothetical protein